MLCETAKLSVSLLDLSVQQKITLDRWDEVRGMARGSKEEIRQLNLYLDQVRIQFICCKEALAKES